MKSVKISACAAAVVVAATSAATAGPANVARLDTLVTPSEQQIELVHYRKTKHRHARRAPNPARGVAGTAVGLAGVGVNTAVGTAHVLGRGWCDFWGYCR
jgi:hypothetical protein